MSQNEPRNHHYVPQFILRNFAIDPGKKKIEIVSKNGPVAIWSKRSIERLGFERDLYVHFERGVPISLEGEINRRIETPISRSETWKKITSGRADALDLSDKPIIYALMRHLEARTPHYHNTLIELSKLAADPNGAMSFSDEERDYYAFIKANPTYAKKLTNQMSSSLQWTEENYRKACLSICRSPIPLRISTTPVIAMRAPSHPALHLPLPGMIPYQLALTLNQTTFATLVIADFEDAFSNIEVGIDVAQGYNRHILGQFSHFNDVRHLVTSRHELKEDMSWAHFEVAQETDRKIIFRRTV